MGFPSCNAVLVLTVMAAAFAVQPAMGGFIYQVDSGSCTLGTAVSNVNAGGPASFDCPPNISADPFDRIVFEDGLTEVSLTQPLRISQSVVITGPPTKVSLVREEFLTRTLFFLDGAAPNTTVTFDNCIFTQRNPATATQLPLPQEAALAGHIHAVDLVELQLLGCNFTGSTVVLSTYIDPDVITVGAVLCDGVKTLTITDCHFETNRALSQDSVGALLAAGLDSVTLTNTVFFANTAFPTGFTALLNCAGPVKVIGCTFANNFATSLFVNRDGDDLTLTVDIEDSYFDTNPSRGADIRGANYVVVRCTANSSPCGFEGHDTMDLGGALFSDSTNVTLIADEGASGLLNRNSGTAGGAVFAQFAVVEVYGMWQISNNRAVGPTPLGRGGAFYAGSFVSSGPLSFEDNTGVSEGGAIFAESNILVEGASRFLRNVASGGGVACSSSGFVSLEVSGPVELNTGNFGGGGVILVNSANEARLAVLGYDETPTEIQGNTARGAGIGGGVIHSEGTAVLEVCIFACVGVDILNNSAGALGGVVNSLGDVTVTLGDSVMIFDNGVTALDGQGGVIFAGGASEVNGGGTFSGNGIGCKNGGAIYSEGSVELTGASLKFEDHMTTSDGGAVFSMDRILVNLLLGLENNRSNRNGGGMFASTSISVISITDIVGNNALQGGAFFSQFVDITVEGTVTGNVANAPVALGSVMFSESSLTDSPTFTAGNNAMLHNNTGSIAHSNGTLEVLLEENTLVMDNEGLFTAVGRLDVVAEGASFVGNSGEYLIHSFTGATLVDSPGAITSNFNLANGFASAARMVTVNSVQGNVSLNSGTAFMVGESIRFTASEPIQFRDNIFDRCFDGESGVQVVAIASAPLDFIDNDCVLLFTSSSGALLELEIEEGSVRGNSAPIFLAEGDSSDINVEAAEITDTVAGTNAGAICHVTSASVDVTLSGGICRNFIDENSPGTDAFFVSSLSGSPVDAEVHIIAGGSIEENISSLPLLPPLLPSGTVDATLYRGPTMDSSITLAVVLEEPISFQLISELDTVMANELFSVELELDTFGVGSVEVIVESSSLSNPVGGVANSNFESSSITFTALFVSGPPGEVDLIFRVLNVCSDISVTVPIEVIGALSSTPTAVPTISPSCTPSQTASLTASRTVSNPATPSVSQSSSRTVSVTASTSRQLSSSPTPSKGISATSSPTIGPSFSSTPSAPEPEPPTPLPPLPSPLPSPPGATKSRSTSRSPSRTMLPAAVPTCLRDCVVAPGVTPVDPSGGNEQVFIVSESGDAVGTVFLPAAAIQPGETVVVGPASPEAEAAARELDLASAVVQITIVGRDGVAMQPTADLEVCLEVDDTDKAEDEGCLSFFDEERQEWICEDPCLEREGDTVCGTVDHLTNFAVLFTGGGGNNGCESDDDGGNLIFDEAWKDGVFVGSFVLAMIAICVFVVIFVTLFPKLTDRIHGREYQRIKTLRTGTAHHSSIAEASVVV